MKKMKINLGLQLLAAVVLSGCHSSIGKMAADRAENIIPLAVGECLPQLNLKNAKAEEISLNKFIDQKPSILIFYRGGWCPYCTRHLQGLQKVVPELKSLGYQLIAISPDRPALLSPLAKEKGLGYSLFSDSSMKASTAMGLAFRLDDATFVKYKDSYNIDIEADSGYKHHLLPVPAVYVVDAEGRVQYRYVNKNYKVRLEPDKLLKAAAQAVR